MMRRKFLKQTRMRSLEHALENWFGDGSELDEDGHAHWCSEFKDERCICGAELLAT